MAFNSSDIDASLYFNYNLMISLALFTLVIIPPLVLSLLCIVGLISTKEINAKIRFSLINLFAGELLRCSAFSFFYLGVPVRLLYEEDVSCKIFVGLFYVAAGQKITSDTLYAIIVSVFIIWGKKTMKWYIIFSFVVISWIISIAMGIIPFLEDVQTSNIKGFCKTNPDSSLFKGLAFSLVGLSLFFIAIQVVCIIFTLVYMKKNVLDGNISLKKVITKVMVYFVISSIITFIVNVIPIANPSIIKQLSNSVVKFVAVNYAIRVVYNIPAIATPIIIIVFLKPVRGALKSLTQDYCKCFNTQVHPLPAAESV